MISFPKSSGFDFAGKSIAEMAGVHWEITVPAHVAIKVCPIDFCFHDGLRSIEEQKRNVSAGVSRTFKTKHLDGDAADLVPFVDGKLVWELGPCIEVARAMQSAIRFLGISQIWGGVWDKRLENLSDDLAAEVEAYRRRYLEAHKADPKKRPLFDGVHFERAIT